MLRKTKIICTLGPAVDSEDLIVALIKGGMNGARFNFPTAATRSTWSG